MNSKKLLILLLVTCTCSFIDADFVNEVTKRRWQRMKEEDVVKLPFSISVVSFGASATLGLYLVQKISGQNEKVPLRFIFNRLCGLALGVPGGFLGGCLGIYLVRDHKKKLKEKVIHAAILIAPVIPLTLYMYWCFSIIKSRSMKFLMPLEKIIDLSGD